MNAGRVVRPPSHERSSAWVAQRAQPLRRRLHARRGHLPVPGGVVSNPMCLSRYESPPSAPGCLARTPRTSGAGGEGSLANPRPGVRRWRPSLAAAPTKANPFGAYARPFAAMASALSLGLSLPNLRRATLLIHSRRRPHRLPCSHELRACTAALQIPISAHLVPLHRVAREQGQRC